MCFLLGAGGLGCTVALALARLGVSKLILLDKDTVEISNLNRQVLFNKDDLGKNKAEVVKHKIEKDHMINTNMKVDSYVFCA